MKLKCPMSFNESRRTPGTTSAMSCIGAACGAYMLRDKSSDGKISGINKGKTIQSWSCAMTPREVWHEVEENK